MLDSLPEVSSAADLVRASWDETRSDAYPELRLGRGSLVLLAGAAGVGKSTMAVRLLGSLPGPVVFVSGEMGLGPAMGELLGRTGVRRRDFHVTGRSSLGWLHDFLSRQNATAVAFDSVQSCGVEAGDMRHLIATTSLRLVVAISQLNRAGQPHAAREVEYDCDIHLAVSDGYWSVVKSRYQACDDVRGPVAEGVANVA